MDKLATKLAKSTMSSPKRAQQVGISNPQQYAHQFDLQTVPMRIRKSVSDGYKLPNGSNQSAITSNMLISQPNNVYQSEYEQETNSISAFKRVPLPSNVVVPPLLSNHDSSFRSTSSLSEWESNVDLRLTSIDNKLNKRSFEDMDEKW